MVGAVFEGRPTDRRSETEERVYDFLDSIGVWYLRADHPPAASTADCGPAEELLGIHICKNLFLCNEKKTSFYLLMMPCEKMFRTKLLSPQIASPRLSFASGELMEEYLRTLPGSASVLSLLFDAGKRVRLLIDGSVLDDEFIGCHPCMNTSSLKIATADLTGKILPALEHSPTIVTL